MYAEIGAQGWFSEGTKLTAPSLCPGMSPGLDFATLDSLMTSDLGSPV